MHVEVQSGLRVTVNAAAKPPCTIEDPECRLGAGVEMYDSWQGRVIEPDLDVDGHWNVEITRWGMAQRVAAPLWSLLWKGACVTLSGAHEFKGRVGLVVSEKRVKNVVCVSPEQMQHCEVLKGSGLRRGAVVKLQDSPDCGKGIVVSAAPDPQGRWQVEVDQVFFAMG